MVSLPIVTIVEQIVKTLPFLYSISIIAVIVFSFPRQTNIKENIWVKASLSIILAGGILDLVVAYKNYDILHPSVLINLGSILLTLVLIRIIKLLFIHAHQDSLTGAYNKRALYYSIERHIIKLYQAKPNLL